VELTVVVASCGTDYWLDLSRRRAIPSVEALGLDPVVAHLPGGTVAEARNYGLDQVTTEWVCFLDADDELELGYVEAMAAGAADVRAPAVRYVPWHATLAYRRADRGRAAVVPRVVGREHANHACEAECLAYGNWLVIGSVVRTELVRDVGGFEEWPVYEDYALWARIWRQTEATFEAVPEAVYRAHVRQSSRNRSALSAREKHRVHQEIARVVGLEVPA
jgi:glycosyltransferase involved in cell wall biosynthesis